MRSIVSAFIGAALIGIIGCAQQDRRAAAAAPEQPAAADSAKSASDAKPQEAASAPADPAEEKEKTEKERRDLTRKLAKAKRELDAGRMRMAKTKLANEQAELNHRLALDKARKELELARQRQKTMIERSTPERVARADLGLQGAQDGFVEADEEFKQLEMMYNEDQFADKTKEIVLERGKRRLDRSKRYLAIETQAVDTLKTQTLPIELAEQEMGLRDKDEALARLERDRTLALLDEKMGIFSAESDMIRLEEELGDAERELADFEKKQAKKAEEEAKKAKESAK